MNFNSTVHAVAERLEEIRVRRLTSRIDIGQGYRRIYHYHVRKSAGTSLNTAFWGLAGVDLSMFSQYRIRRNGYVFVRHSQSLIEAGDYFFANSHRPAYLLSLPPRTFTITILRDPLSRLISYYRYLRWAVEDPRAPELDPSHPMLVAEAGCLGSSFGEFLDRCPAKHLMTQLHMFSGCYDPAEAAERASVCSAIGFTEEFDSFIQNLSGRLRMNLKTRRERHFNHQVSIHPEEMQRARDALAPEYEFLRKVRHLTGG